MKKFKYPALIFVLMLSAAGSSFAQVEKGKLICGLGYYNDNNRVQYLKANTKTKIDGKFKPVGGIQVSFYISAETPANLLGSAKTDDKGQAALIIPPAAKDEWNKSPNQTFLAVTDSSEFYDAVTSSIDLTKARIRLDTAEDKKIIATVVEQKKSAWVPVKGVDLSIAVKRLGADLNIVNETPVFTTDSLGVVKEDFKLLNLPGDSLGSLILVARIEDNDKYGNITAEKRVPWGTASEYVSDYNQRSLSARRGFSPFWLQWIAYGTIVAVWGILLYLFFQIWQLKKLGVQG
jgi:hypothetical protein